MRLGGRTLAALSLSVVIALAVVIGGRKVLAATVVVSPSNMHGWVLDQYNGGPPGVFVTGPSGVPSGIGSLFLTQGGSQGGSWWTGASVTGYAGVRLSDLTDLRYTAYSTSVGGSGDPGVNIWVMTGLGVDELSFFPENQASPPPTQTWHEVDLLHATWYSNDFSGVGAATISQYLSFVAAFTPEQPTLLDNPCGNSPSPCSPVHGSIEFAKGGSVTETTSLDTVSVGVLGSSVTYDFEPDVATTPTSTFTATATLTPTSTPTPTPTATATSCPGACPPTSTFTPTATHVSVGGIAEQPDVSALPTAAASSGRNYTMYILGVAGAGLAALGAGAWAIWRRRRVS
jgi:hypothetical protein